jgi:hypothetical protein
MAIAYAIAGLGKWVEDDGLPAAARARFCPVCDERVPVAEDGLHCHRGHRLSPAHARRRGWLRGRRRSH